VSCGFDSFIGGVDSSATNNTGVVTGTGSQWHSENGFYVGYMGGGNRLLISSGGVVSNGLGVVGSFGSSNNVVTVTDANSAWKIPEGDLTIGDSQSTGNHLLVTNGGLMTSLTAALGSADVAGGNTVTVTGNASRWLWVTLSVRRWQSEPTYPGRRPRDQPHVAVDGILRQQEQRDGERQRLILRNGSLTVGNEERATGHPQRRYAQRQNQLHRLCAYGQQ
jgi:T5SS/PEP-CTERM-associated repeat protein